VREEGNGSNYDAILPRMLYLYVKYGSFFDWITQQLAIISNLMSSIWSLNLTRNFAFCSPNLGLISTSARPGLSLAF